MNAPAKRQPIPFGNYLLLDRINIGGMAEVWRGKMFGAGGFERLVAIKRILPNIAEDEEFITMFLDEAKITVQLTHANIAQVYDLNKVQNSYYIAMEYVPGKDLRAIFDRCRKKGEPAPIPLTCYVVAKMCEGLDFAHRRKDQMGRDMNIVHRDISPQNVLISYDGEVKVIDFGIAKAAGKASKTQAGILKGKFAYMSPEQIRGLPLDRRSDLFAVGVCLYEMLTGERLFVGDSDFSVLEKVRKAEVLPPSTFNRRIPEALEGIVLKALAKDVEDRYQHCEDLAAALQRFLITSDSVFTRNDLMQYMKSTFAEDVEREKIRLQEYLNVKLTEGHQAAIEMGLNGPAPLAAPAPAPLQPGPPQVAAPAAPRQSLQNIPVLAPPTLQPAAPPTLEPTNVPRRSPSLTGIPKLTAAAPLLGNPQQEEEGGATMLVAGHQYFDERPEPGTDPGGGLKAAALTAQPPAGFIPDSGSTAVVAPPAAMSDRLMQTSWESGGQPPSPSPSQKRPSRPSLGKVQPPAAREEDGPDEQTVPTSPHRPALRQAPPAAAPGMGKTALVAIAFAILLVVAGVGVVLLRGPGDGLLYVEIPKELHGKAHLSINGKDYGVQNAPYFSRYPAGAAAVVVTADGWKPYAGSVEVVAGKDVTRLDPKLVPDQVFAPLAVAFQPEEAELRINGQVVKKQGERAGPYLGELPVGKESVLELTLPGHTGWIQKVTPAAQGAPVKFGAALEQLHRDVTVTSDPAGARIYLAGRDLGETPATLRLSPTGAQLTLKKHCFDDAPLAVAPGEGKGSVSAKLKRQRGCR